MPDIHEHGNHECVHFKYNSVGEKCTGRNHTPTAGDVRTAAREYSCQGSCSNQFCSDSFLGRTGLARHQRQQSNPGLRM